MVLYSDSGTSLIQNRATINWFMVAVFMVALLTNLWWLYSDTVKSQNQNRATTYWFMVAQLLHCHCYYMKRIWLCQ